jgi:hypothetical protein
LSHSYPVPSRFPRKNSALQSISGQFFNPMP